MSYQIGDFSKVSKISPRMLRYLDQEGLLKPSEVLENGYRVYSESDLKRVAAIVRLKQFAFTYSEIKKILEDGDEHNTLLLQRQLDKLLNELQIKSSVIHDLSLSLSNKTTVFSNTYEIVLLYREPMWELSRVECILPEQIESFLKRMSDWAQNISVPLLAYYRISFQFEGETGSDVAIDALDGLQQMEWKQAVASPVEVQGFTCKQAAAGFYLSTKHYGNYDTLYGAYSALFNYANHNDLWIIGDYEESFLVDARFTSDSNCYITEVQVLVKKKY